MPGKPPVKLELFESSWENFFECIQDEKTRINSKGNFWASFQHLQSQLFDYKHREKKNDQARSSE